MPLTYDEESLDPAGTDEQRERLRARGQLRFTLRGVIGFGGPLFFWFVVSDLRHDIRTAEQLHQPVLSFLAHRWAAGAVGFGAVGLVVGFLAWKRLLSDYWPTRKPDPEASHIRLGL